MNQIQIWQLGVDVCLVMAILVMAFRWMKGSQAQALLPRTLELESSLRALIGEADAAGRHLNEQLLRREQNLQKFLGDIDAAEQRLVRAIPVSEERNRELELGREKAEAILREINAVLGELREELRQGSSPRENRAPSKAAQRRAEPPPPTFEAAESLEEEEVIETVPSRREVPRERPSTPQARSTSQRSTEVNYPGGDFQIEPPQRSPEADQAASIRRSRAAQPTPEAPQAKRAPRTAPQRQTQYEAAQQNQGDLRRIYAAAEDLLRQGKQLEHVSAQTRIPLEEVQLLSQMIEVERDDRARSEKRGAQAPADPRLGALGAIKRQTTSL